MKKCPFKGYNVMVRTKHFCHFIDVKSIKNAQRIMNMRIWKYGRIMDNKTGLVILIKN